ncbi:MAG: hypothetical protein AABY15_02905 [Nanoarchaeota archaeon]
MKKLLFILTTALLSSCVEDDPNYIDGHSVFISDHKNIKYFKDTRTDFCFAERGSGNEYTFTCVPCTEEVENLIKYSK